jgi:predicted ATP-binding protein involved in virulence
MLPSDSSTPGAEPATFLTSLELKNFRTFDSSLFHFSNRLTVIFGKNGAGKSSIIDALSIVLMGELMNTGISDAEGVLQAVSDTRRVAKVFGESLVYEPAMVCSINAKGSFGFDKNFSIEHHFPVDPYRGSDSQYAAVGIKIRSFLHSNDSTNLPLFAVFRAARRYANDQIDHSNLPVSRADGYRQCLDVARSSDALRSWFKRQVLKRGRTGVASSEARTVLAALQDAVPNLVGFDYDADLADLVVNFGEGEVPFGSLSDGQRGFFGMIAEITIRCVQLNPHHNGEAIRLTEGLVLVDEVDLHLHPAWQRSIIRSLTNTFPKIQFLITTHSPIVLTEVEQSSILDLDRPEDGFVPDFSSLGKDSGWVTRHLMHASTRPEWAADALSNIEAAIDNESDDEARRLIALLRDRLGDQLDPDLIRWEVFVGEAAE